MIDSDFTDQGLSFQVIQAAKLAQAGAGVPEILAEIERVKQNTKLYIGISTLDNLVKVDESAVQQDYYQTFLI